MVQVFLIDKAFSFLSHDLVMNLDSNIELDSLPFGFKVVINFLKQVSSENVPPCQKTIGFDIHLAKSFTFSLKLCKVFQRILVLDLAKFKLILDVVRVLIVFEEVATEVENEVQEVTHLVRHQKVTDVLILPGSVILVKEPYPDFNIKTIFSNENNN